MALTLEALKLLKPYLKGRVLQLGYHDLLPTPEEIETLFEVCVKERTNYGSWHDVKHPLVETQALFEALGCHSICIDIARSRGCEVVCDLNYDSPSDVLNWQSYDLVIDGGTLEHVFNIGQALMSVAHTVKVGGVIFHGNPINWINHGFYSISPTLFHDFYTQNGWNILHSGICDRKGHTQTINPTQRVLCPAEISNLFVARRDNAKSMAFPIQTKYQVNPTLTKE